jgi:4-amino-4-deoxy-L-arabinose transferase-like glycosyltransferase
MMNRSIGRAAAALAVCLLASAALVPAADAAAVIHYQHESYVVFQRQLASGQITAVTFNKKPHSAHITLKDGQHVLAIYPSHDEPQLAALLTAKGVTVAVEKHKVAVKPVHHTLRYIAGGILVVVILAILAVLLIGRRRNLADGVETPGAGAVDSSG